MSQDDPEAQISPADVKRILQLAKKLSAEGKARSHLKIGTLVEEYLEHARGYYRRPDGTQTGEASNMADALKVLQEHYPDTDPQEFSPRDLQACQQHLIAQKLSRTTINDRIKRVLRFFRWCTARSTASTMSARRALVIWGDSRNDPESGEMLGAV